MKIEEIRKACFAGKTFTFNNVKIHEFDMSDGVFNIIYSLPSVENQPYCQGFDVKEISVYEPAKYDPCRLLRKGDRVQVKKRNGRCNGKHGEYLREAFCEVAEDEVPNELVRVYHNSSEYLLDPAYLELVTPVEELEPYFVAYDDKFYHVHKKGEDAALAVYYETKHPHAKEAAEAECARLNAEYRKEQNNGNQ